MSDTYAVTVNGEEYEVDAASPQEAERKVHNLYGSPVPFKEGFRPPVQHTPRELAEGALEGAPMAGGMAGAALGAAPGAALGAAGGEAVRQIGRRAMGEPAATGLIQRAAGMDPDSPAAAATGIAAEAVLGGSAEKIAQAMRWASGALTNWAGKSRWALLRPGATRADEASGLALAERMKTEGIAPGFSGRAEQVGRAEAALADASSRRAAAEAAHAADIVDAEPVLKRVVGQIPENLPGGGIPRVGRPERGAAMRVADDVSASLRDLGGLDVPFPAAQSEKRRWDSLLKSFYERGAVAPSAAQAPTKGAADAWRAAIADQYPDIGAANLRESELIDIARMLRMAQQSERLGSPAMAGSLASGVGAGATGRTSILAAALSRLGLTSPRFTSMSAAGKDLAARLLADPQAQQAYIRMAQLAAFDPEAIRRRREAAQLLNQGEGVTTP